MISNAFTNKVINVYSINCLSLSPERDKNSIIKNQLSAYEADILNKVWAVKNRNGIRKVEEPTRSVNTPHGYFENFFDLDYSVLIKKDKTLLKTYNINDSSQWETAKKSLKFIKELSNVYTYLILREIQSVIKYKFRIKNYLHFNKYSYTDLYIDEEAVNTKAVQDTLLNKCIKITGDHIFYILFNENTLLYISPYNAYMTLKLKSREIEPVTTFNYNNDKIYYKSNSKLYLTSNSFMSFKFNSDLDKGIFICDINPDDTLITCIYVTRDIHILLINNNGKALLRVVNITDSFSIKNTVPIRYQFEILAKHTELYGDVKVFNMNDYLYLFNIVNGNCYLYKIKLNIHHDNYEIEYYLIGQFDKILVQDIQFKNRAFFINFISNNEVKTIKVMLYKINTVYLHKTTYEIENSTQTIKNSGQSKHNHLPIEQTQFTLDYNDNISSTFSLYFNTDTGGYERQFVYYTDGNILLILNGKVIVSKYVLDIYVLKESVFKEHNQFKLHFMYNHLGKIVLIFYREEELNGIIKKMYTLRTLIICNKCFDYLLDKDSIKAILYDGIKQCINCRVTNIPQDN